MWKFIEKLRALPEESRKIAVLFFSGIITALLLVSWLVFPVPHFGLLSDTEKERKNAQNLTAPFSVIGGEIHEATRDIKEKWTSLGGIAGISSAVLSLKENTAENATSSTVTSVPEEKALPTQKAFLNENTASSTKNEPTAATTTAVTE